MEEKSNLYIVAIVGVVAVVALVILVLGVGIQQSVVTLPNTITTDEAGQAMVAPPSSDGGGVYTAIPGTYSNFVIGLGQKVCWDTDRLSGDTDNIGLNYKVKGTASIDNNRYTDTCMVDSTVVDSCIQAPQAGSHICYLKEYWCLRPLVRHSNGALMIGSWYPDNLYGLMYTKIPRSSCSNGASISG
jgi:hypothetical protein